MLAAFSDKPLIGEADSENVRLRKLSLFNNALQPEFNATLERYGSGTRLDCRIGLRIPARIFLYLLLPFCLLLGIGSGIGVLAALIEGRDFKPMASVACAVLAGPIVFICVGWYLARGEKDLLERVVVVLLDAQRDGT
jgi:hypothetical protein